MNIDKAKKVLSTVKKRKLANGCDLTVAVRGAEALYMIMFHLTLTLLIISNSGLREYPWVLLPVIAVIASIILVCIFFHKKVYTARELMIKKRVYNLDEIEN